MLTFECTHIANTTNNYHYFSLNILYREVLREICKIVNYITAPTPIGLQCMISSSVSLSATRLGHNTIRCQRFSHLTISGAFDCGSC